MSGMTFTVLNNKFETITTIDSYSSIVWTDRFNSCGDFELYVPPSLEVLDYLKTDHYLWFTDSEHIMCIESREIKDDVEFGLSILITGRSLESILDRRIIWTKTQLTGNLQNGIQKLLNENIISPTIVDRKIENFIFKASTDPIITAMTFEGQFTGDNLLEVISAICQVKKIGFKLTLNLQNQFIFELYVGKDRSYSQDLNPYIEFSPNFDNLLSSNYLESKEKYKTVNLVAGEGNDNARKTVVVEVSEGAGKGLIRRELYTDARDLTTYSPSGTISAAEYEKQLKSRGSEKLKENSYIKVFDGSVETTRLYKYGSDFFMGDIIQMVNEFGITSRSRIVELVRSQDKSGINVYPSLESIDEEGATK